MSAEWSLIWKHVLSIVQKRLPGWILKKWFPHPKCINSVEIFLGHMGPHIYINPERSPAISPYLEIRIFNRLPFKIELLSFTLIEIALEDKKLLNFQHTANSPIESHGFKTLQIPERDLTDGQVRIISVHPTDCPIMRIHGSAQFRSPVGDFTKDFSTQTRSFIYRGNRRNKVN